MVLSSSFPGHIICPRYTARMQVAAVESHNIISRMVRALQTPLMPGLWKALPTCIAASVIPAFGNMNAHQLSVKVIRRIPCKTATVEMQKNQKAKRRRKVPDKMPNTLTMSPSGMLAVVKISLGRTFGA